MKSFRFTDCETPETSEASESDKAQRSLAQLRARKRDRPKEERR